MFKIYLKHLIFEKCINILFDAINKNFCNHKAKKFTFDMFHIGDTYDYMQIRFDGKIWVLYECRIHDLFPQWNNTMNVAIRTS